jgi:hypothetical protein
VWVPVSSAIRFDLDFPTSFLDEPTQRAGFVLLAAFLCSFLFIRTSARLMRSPKVPWWPGSVTTGSGLHLHHLVWGIVLMMLAGFLGFVTPHSSPWTEILAGLFGVGVGLTLDEFALWVHLRDVYWAEEGRKSLDAVIVAALIGGLVVLGVAPFDLHNSASSVASLVLTVLIAVLLAVVAILKGRRLLGLAGIFIPIASLVACLRLATPESPWARRFYSGHQAKLARSRARYARIRARRLRVANAVAGAPEAPAVERTGEHSEMSGERHD